MSASDPSCHCAKCNPNAWWMVVCAICGNKRCPKARDHRYDCTGSNAPDQVATRTGVDWKKPEPETVGASDTPRADASLAKMKLSGYGGLIELSVGRDLERELAATELLAEAMADEVARYLPILELAEKMPTTWAAITKGAGIATTNALREKLDAWGKRGGGVSERKLSDQYRWQLKRLAMGLCSQCGKEPLLTKWHCVACVQKHRKRNLAKCRKLRGSKLGPDDPLGVGGRKRTEDKPTK